MKLPCRLALQVYRGGCVTSLASGTLLHSRSLLRWRRRLAFGL